MKLFTDRNGLPRFNHALFVAGSSLLLGWATLSQGAQVDLSRVVVVGDSLMAGYQNGSLRGSQQVHGIAALIAQQARVALPLPLIADPGIPNALTIVDPGSPPTLARLPGVSSGRVDLFLQPFNLSVPGHSVQDALLLRPGFPIDNLTDLVLGLPGLLSGVSRSQVEWAEALRPTAIIAWVGPNDTLGAAFEADPSFVTPVAVFTSAYTELVRRLAATGAPLVLANIPDVTVIPYLTSAQNVAREVGAPLTLIGPMLGIESGDYVTPDALPFIEAILTGAAAGPLPDGVVLTANEVAVIRAATAEFNAIIAAQAHASGAALVDTHTFLNSLRERGLVVHGQRLTTEFLGGIFSLDGIHPTNTGAAATANEFIAALNTKFAAGVPPVNVLKVAEEDPLVLLGAGHPASALREVDEGTVQSLRAVIRH